MFREDWIGELNLQSGAVAIAIVLAALALILYLNRKSLLLRWRDWQLRRQLDRIGSEQIRRLQCDDGLDGLHEIDRLAMLDDAILIVSCKPFRGNIYCAEQIEEWTQVIGQKSFKFANPLFELEHQITSLRLIVGNVPLRGCLLFGQGAAFPKGHPDSVLHPDKLPPEILAANNLNPQPEIAAAWASLKAHQSGAASQGRVGANT